MTQAVAIVLPDTRRQASCEHSVLEMVRQRIYALALGYEDLIDQNELRHDTALQTAVNTLEPLASASPLCRLENRMEGEAAVALHEVLIDQFIARHKTPPKELMLDFDATNDAVHGDQEGCCVRFLNLGTKSAVCYLLRFGQGHIEYRDA